MNTIIGQPIHLLTVVDSTNNYAMEKIQCGEAEHGEVYMALEQTAGKGQRGRKWMADPGTNIIMSLVLNTCSLKMEQQFLLSAAMALGCCDFFRKKSEATEITIKWPNDLYWHDRKAGGILIENRIQASASGSIWAWSVVGIGINVNQIHFPEEIADRATSLRQITGHSENVAELIHLLCEELHKRWYQLIATDESEDILMDYNNCLYKKGQKVTLRKGEHSWETTVQEVDHSGHLITHDRTTHRLAVGEIEWLRPTK